MTTKLTKDSDEAFVWLLSKLEEDTDPKFLGYIEVTDGFYFPNNQPLKEYLILAQVSEYNGTIMLIDNNKTVEIPGYYFGVSDNVVFTKAAGDGDQMVGYYNVRTGELETKVWNNINGSDPWDIKNDYNYEDFQWINMANVK